MKELLKAVNCCFSYEDGTKALNEVNFTIRQGEKVAFLGGNGSGKSTMFLCLNGILRPQKGMIYFENKPLDYSRKGLINLRSRVGIVFQNPDYQLFSASVYEDISFGILNLGVTKEKAKMEVESIIKELEIIDFMDKPTHSLSGGQKKQVSIADILVMKPKIILLDEPASALDPKHVKLIRKYLNDMSEKGITIIVSTHNMDYALSFFDRVILFKEGEIVEDGKPEVIFLKKQVIEETNLEQPQVIKLYQNLKMQGILNNHTEIPKTLEQLEQYIQKERWQET